MTTIQSINATFSVACAILLVSFFSACDWRPGWSIGLFSMTLVTWAVATMGSVIQLTHTQNPSWPGGAVLITIGSICVTLAPWPDSARLRPHTSLQRHGGFIALPVAYLCGATGILVAGAFDLLPAVDRSVRALALLLAALGVLLIAVRFVITVRHVNRLPEALRQARTDELTGLANRRGLHRRLSLQLNENRGRGLIVMLVDIDRFKQVNDTLGHPAGDQLLARIADRLTDHTQPQDILGRVGGDEFVVLHPAQPASPEIARQVAQSVLAAFERPFQTHGISMHVDASIGVAVAPEHGLDADTLLRRADIAMYLAKAAPDPIVVYDDTSDNYTLERLRLRQDLHKALQERTGLLLYYQPQLDLTTSSIDGAEALIRWRHPRRGLLLPGAFLPDDDDPRACRELTARVLEMAVADLRVWRGHGFSARIAVNVSALDLIEGDLPERVSKLLQRHEIPGEALKIELTETTVMAHPAQAATTLHRLRDLGCCASLDDFGTGYSALSLLARLPLDEVKIDRSFVHGLGRHPGDEAVVRAAVGLGRDLGLSVLAEGVEDHETMHRLAAFGCTHVQGYAIAAPMPAEEFTDHLAAA